MKRTETKPGHPGCLVTHLRRPVRTPLFLLSLLLVAGCAADGQDKTFGERIQWTTRTVEPKSWVAASRTGEDRFIPVGVTPANRPTAAMSPSQLAAATAELDSIGAKSSAAASRPERTEPSRAALLAEQKKRLAAAGLLDKAKLPKAEDLMKEAEKSRAFARRPVPGAPDQVPAVQPSSWPVPAHLRSKRKGTAECETTPEAKDCIDIKS